MIVQYQHRPKRPRKPAPPVEIAVPRVVHHTRRGQVWRPLADDPEADARVQAFFNRMIRAKKQMPFLTDGFLSPDTGTNGSQAIVRNTNDYSTLLGA
jgi:hypothetical protein